MEDSLIDSGLNETPKDIIFGIMRWWEKKRVLFNSIILGVAIIAVVVHFATHSGRVHNLFEPPFFILTLLYFAFINVCYCAGWGIQLLGYYYFNIQHHGKALDVIMFVFGTLFTSLVTYGGYESYLY